MRRSTCLVFTLCFALVLSSPRAFSQTQATGAIVGRAQDSSGALIPGVEVTISSPSMIGGARTAVTDEQGSYRFTLLAPGTYRVSFLLQGFKTINIDGNDVVAGRTLTVTGSLEVATVAEEVTVTSQAPTIDLEAATVGVNWSQKNLDALPYARTLTGLVTMIPGLYATSYDVGGSAFGNGSAPAARSYGRSGGAVVSYDGLIWCQTYGDYGSYEEVNITTASKGAEQMNPGVSMNMIIKSGSNQFHGNFSGLYENGSMQSNNVDQALRDRGYSAGSNKFTHYRNIYGDVGGPILKDKLWFYFAYTNGYQGALVPGFISLKTGQQAENWIKIIDPTAKLTYQLTSKQKLEAVWQLNRKWAPYRNASSLVPLEATMDQDAWSTLGPQLKWTNILGPRTTATAGIARGGYWWPAYPWSPDVRKTDTTTGATLGGYLKNYTRPIRWQWNFDVSRVTSVAGRSNEIKFGYFGWWDKSYTLNFGYPNQQLYRYTSLSTDTCPDKIVCPNYFLRPNSVQMFDYPNSSSTGGRYKAAYFNDKIVWNRKLTVNVGARVDHFTSFLSRQGNPGEGPWSVKAIFEYTDAFPKYTRWSPRMSFAYDVTGTGKLAVKGSFGRYINVSSSPGSQPGPGAGSSGVNPNSSKTCTYNRWDGTIPYVPSLGADGVMGTADDVNLSGACTGGAGSNGIHTFDSNLRSAYLDEYTAGLEVGFSRTYSMRFNVVRKFDHGGSKTVDVLLPSSAYTDVRSAVDRGRDGIAGTADDGIVYAWSVPSTNANRTVVNQQFTNVDLTTHEGQNMYTAFETTFNKQFSNKWSYLAAYTVDLAHPSNSNPLNPNSAYYNWQLPTWSQSFKMNGTYDFPWGFKYASTFTAQTGDWYSRTAQVVNALNSTITQTVEGHFGRYDWVKLWDQRVTKSFKFGDRQNLELSWDLFNSMNTNTVTNQTVNSSSSTYLIPSAIISPRIYQWGFKYKF